MNCLFATLLVALLTSLAYANAAGDDAGEEALCELPNGDWLFDNGLFCWFLRLCRFTGCKPNSQDQDKNK